MAGSIAEDTDVANADPAGPRVPTACGAATGCAHHPDRNS